MSASAGTAYIDIRPEVDRRAFNRELSRLGRSLDKAAPPVKIRADASGVHSAASSAQSAMRGLVRTAQVTGAGITAGLGYGLTKGAKAGFRFNAQMESGELAFKRFVGGAKPARDLLADLVKTAERTPFELTDLVSGTRRLLAFGMEAEQAERLMRATGDAVAAAGGGAEQIDAITRALGQIQAKGKVSAEELLQLSEAGIPAQKILQRELGLTGEQVADIGNQGIPAGKAIAALTRGMERDFKGAAAEQSRTWDGMISSMRDGWSQMTGAVTQDLFDEAKRWAPQVNDTMKEVTRIFRRDDLQLDDKLKLSTTAAEQRLQPLLRIVRREFGDIEVGEALGDAIRVGLPALANAAADVAPDIAGAFWDGFKNMGTGGQVLTAAFILSRLGGGGRRGAFFGAGRGAGGGFLAGFGGAVTGGLGAAAAQGLGERLSGRGGLAGKAGNILAQRGSTPAQPLFVSIVGRGVPAGGAGRASSAATGAAGAAGGAAGAARTGARVVGGAAGVAAAVGGVKAISDALKGVPGSDLGLLNQYATQLERVAKVGSAPGMTALAAKLRETARANSDIKTPHLQAFAQALDLAASTGGRDLSALQAAFKNMARSSSGDLERLRQELGSGSSQGSIDLQKLGRVSDQFAANLRGLKLSGSKDFGTLVNDVTFGSKRILEVGGSNSKKTREEVGRQFAIARDRVKDAMDKKIISVEEGTKRLAQLARRELGLYGISAGKVNVVLAKGANGEARPNQRGGFIVPGTGTGDSVQASLPSGSFVLNRRATEAYGLQRGGHVPVVLEPRERVFMPAEVRKVGRQALERMNATVPRFQTGGIVALGRKLQAEGYQVGEHPAFGSVGRHTANSYHYRGMALDINADGKPGGEAAWLDRLHARLKGMQGVVELLWRTAGHFDHLHVAMSGAGSLPGGTGDALTANVFEGLPRVQLRGPESVQLEAGQGVLDRVRGAANAYIEQRIPAADGGGSYTSFSGAWTDLMATIAGERNWNLDDWKTLVQKESGGNPAARNPSSGAYGLGQFLGSTLEAYRKHGAGSPDGVDQIRAMARYICNRYGNPSKALAFHRANNWYQRGGLVRMLSAGGPAALAASGKRAKDPAKPKRRSSRADDVVISGAQEFAREQVDRYRSRLDAILSGDDGLKTVGAAKRFIDTDALIEQLGQQFANTERAHGLTDEQSTKTVPVSQASDDELRVHGLGDSDIALLRAEKPERTVELLDPPQIQQRVGEIDQLVAFKDRIAAHFGEQMTFATDAFAVLQAGISERLERAAKIRDRVRENIAEIEKLTARAAEMDRDEKEATTTKARRDLSKRHAPERKRIAKQLDGLRDENERLTGSRSVNVSLKAADVQGGELHAVHKSREAWLAARQNLLGATDGLGQRLVDNALDRDFLLKDRRQWLSTPPPGIDVPVPDAPAEETASTFGAEQKQLRTELIKEQLADERKRRMVAEAQIPLLRGAPYGGSFKDGGTVPGPVGAPRTITAHGGERVVSVDELRDSRRGQIRVIVEDHRVRVFEDDVERIVEKVNRRTGRAAARSLPGGTRRI